MLLRLCCKPLLVINMSIAHLLTLIKTNMENSKIHQIAVYGNIIYGGLSVVGIVSGGHSQWWALSVVGIVSGGHCQWWALSVVGIVSGV